MLPPTILPLVEQQRSALERLCRSFHVGRLELFGSAASGQFRPDASDLDFLVEFVPLTPTQKADAYLGLLHGLEDLFQRRVDLVTKEAIANRRLLESIDRQRKLLYAA